MNAQLCRRTIDEHFVLYLNSSYHARSLSCAAGALPQNLTVTGLHVHGFMQACIFCAVHITPIYHCCGLAYFFFAEVYSYEFLRKCCKLAPQNSLQYVPILHGFVICFITLRRFAVVPALSQEGVLDETCLIAAGACRATHGPQGSQLLPFVCVLLSAGSTCLH